MVPIAGNATVTSTPVTPETRQQTPRLKRVDVFRHKLSELVQGVAFMAELGEDRLDVSRLVKDLVVALQQQSTTRVHPILYVNLAMVVTLAFSAGMMVMRVNSIEARVDTVEHRAVPSMDGIQRDVNNLQQEFGRLRDRIDRYMDKSGTSSRERTGGGGAGGNNQPPVPPPQ